MSTLAELLQRLPGEPALDFGRWRTTTLDKREDRWEASVEEHRAYHRCVETKPLANADGTDLVTVLEALLWQIEH